MIRRVVGLVLAGAVAIAGCGGPTRADPPVPAPTTLALPTAPTSTTTAAPTTTFLPDGVDPGSMCLTRAIFDDPSQSEYLLPYPVGRFFQVTQSYCRSDGGHRGQLSYDFAMPLGTEIIASRAGVVRGVREDSPDNGRGNGEHNFVFIEHDDGTTAFYAHLMQEAVIVAVGDQVTAGEVIGLSGNSGLSSHPHLHFGVYSSWPPTEGYDEPVNFRNAAGRLDPRGGLIEGLVYEAEPQG